MRLRDPLCVETLVDRLHLPLIAHLESGERGPRVSCPPPQTPRTKVSQIEHGHRPCTPPPRQMAGTLGQAPGGHNCAGGPSRRDTWAPAAASAAASAAATLSCAAAAVCRMLITGTMQQRKSGRGGTMSRVAGTLPGQAGSRKDLQVPGARPETARWRGN